ncbi:protein phosphatase methylesterase [Chloropicon primus]|uniref:protein phosphatase methylesterase-1 n=2 Tax=Chloropicon primus TaxID=1764295 RepID=A0A5B8MQI0_9CHLO|nr:protein phosphatase methylesterase [Chloropicon primus]|eukprot:QDZ22779.1 protein phosphatase methylesterase [Chloropicon primus]
MEAFPSEGGDQAPSRLNIPRNPAVTAPENRMRNPNKFGLMRKESFGVPRIKNHTELLKGMFEKKQLPPGMTSLKEKEAAMFHTSGANTGAFPGTNVPSMKSFEALPWGDYFEVKKNVEVASGKDGTKLSFNMYTTGEASEDRPLVYCIHGGGYTGLTWALLAKKLRDKYTIAALDLRSHGESSQSEDYSIEALAKDVTLVWQECFGSTKPKTVLLGHSLGGAIAIHASSLESIPSLAGTIVIDVVEGTAMASLPYMQQVINKRPKTFKGVEEFVKYAYSSGLTKNFEAARVSASSQVKKNPGTSEYAWITDLMATEPFWKEWYQGLSARFLKVPAPKLLLLAGTDRLDKDLTIGQMQGKFQMKVLPAGHAIQEDEPDKTAEAVDDFITRFQTQVVQ